MTTFCRGSLGRGLFKGVLLHGYMIVSKLLALLAVVAVLMFFQNTAHAAIAYVASASNPVDNNSLSTSPVVVTPPGAILTGDLVILVANSRVDSVTMSMSQTGGQIWTAQTNINSSGSQRIFWARFDGAWTSNPSVAFNDPTSTTVVMHVFRPSSGSNTWAIDVPQTSFSSVPFGKNDDVTIGGITTNTNDALVFATWTSTNNNQWILQTSGWTNAGGGQYRNTASSDASQSSAYKVMPTVGSSGSVVNRQSSNGPDNGNVSILAFRQVSLPAPIVTSIAPASGPTVGGTAVTITGTNLTGATAYTIGGASLTGATVVNSTTITGITPAGTAGAQNVVVTTPYGTGTGTGLFTYLASPIAEYRFDEGSAGTVTDSSGKGLSGALNGGVTVGGSGRICNGYNFNGSNAFVSVPNTALLNPTQITVAAWVRHMGSATTTPWETIVAKGDSAYRLHLLGQACSLNSKNTLGALTFGVNGGCAGADVSSGIRPVSGTWYHVVGTYDGVTIKIYVDGTLQGSAAYAGAIASNMFPLYIGENAQQAGRYWSGDLDEVKIFSGALTASQISAGYANESAVPGKNWDGTARVCAATGPDHYQLSVPSTSLTCLPTIVTVTACTNNSNPCNSVATGVTGTASLTTTGGTIGAATLTAGVGTTALSYPGATDGTSASVSLASASIPATNTATCLGGSCATTFSTAGLIFSTARDAVAATIPTQVAGVPSGTYYVRAVKTNTATKACETALTGKQSVDLGYECKDPTGCYASNLMSVNGSETGDGGWGAATTILGNNDGSHASAAPVKVTFDSNGNAPLTFVYSDVGRVTLWASTTVNSAILTGSTLPAGGFLVKPYDFAVVPCAAMVVGPCTSSPADPGLTGGGSVFSSAGNAFKVTTTARALGGLATPSFGTGSNNATETVTLTHTRVAPTSAGAVDGALGGTTSSPRNGFANGTLTVNDLTWSEVGMITLNATNSTFLGSTISTTGTTGNVGRFIPDHFDTTAIGPLGCPTGLCISPVSTMTYSVQAFDVKVTAKNAGGGTTQNYQGTFAKGVTLRPVASNGGVLIASASPGGTLSANTLAAADFAAGVNTATPASPVFTFTTVPTTPTDVYIRAVDSDVVSSLRNPASSSAEGGIKVVSGRLKIGNAYGSELLTLPMKATAQYYSGASWLTSIVDSISAPGGTVSAAAVTGSTLCTGLGFVATPMPLVSGIGSFTLTKPTNGRCSADITLSSPSYLPSVSGRATFGIYKSPLIYRRENY